MKNNKRYLWIIATFLLAIIVIYLAKDKISCFSLNYKLQHNDIEVVKSDSAHYFKQFHNKNQTKAFKLSLLEFGGRGCKPCMRMDTVLKEIAQIYKENLNLKIIRLTSRENRKIAKYFGIREIPVQVILNTKGEEVFRHIGFMDKQDLQKEIDKQLNDN